MAIRIPYDLTFMVGEIFVSYNLMKSNKWQVIAVAGYVVDLLLLIVTNGAWLVVHVPYMFVFTAMYLYGWKQAYLDDQARPASLWVLGACLFLGLYFFAAAFIPVLVIFYLVMRKKKKEKYNTEPVGHVVKETKAEQPVEHVSKNGQDG